jgi:hypothetical protein
MINLALQFGKLGVNQLLIVKIKRKKVQSMEGITTKGYVLKILKT